ncbi:uncharacterized protein J8A68_005883 [[Candida] subhashii]|uniref:Transcription factor Iwr1 domain-containing protein n=1 Tax=[Candida] subhashii TaxID=561895 RepID=A0A8J5UH30_9ASCO|nr:uncharacterized protein J8A68_005883 [[Candida] subhashii]KAG7660617.1 hypothetical protein J8A68_005883 [[Candida] subhashii]
MSETKQQPQPPRILRIKRKRHQDPLQALILEDTRAAKRSKPSSPKVSPKLAPVDSPLSANQQPSQSIQPSQEQQEQPIVEPPSNYVFKLARTDNPSNVNIQDESIINTILSESQTPLDIQDTTNNESQTKKKFIIPRNQIEEDVIIPHELSDMIDSFLISTTATDKPSIPKRKKRGRKDSISPDDHAEHQGEEEEEEEGEYVYDVYHLTTTEPMTTANHPQSQIGYIRFFNDEEDDMNNNNGRGNILMNNEEDNKSGAEVMTDDEDSNAESFYQNDYPSDEDAGVYSDTNNIEAGGDGIGVGVADEEEGYVPHEGIGLKEDEYFEYNEIEDFQLDEEKNDDHDDDDLDEYGDGEYEDENEVGYKRNIFFKSDESDPMAIHRDKIFGRLERMINES